MLHSIAVIIHNSAGMTQLEDLCLFMQVRGKTVYLQYSNRQEIVNAKNTADTPSNVLLVSLENLMVSSPLPIFMCTFNT